MREKRNRKQISKRRRGVYKHIRAIRLPGVWNKAPRSPSLKTFGTWAGRLYARLRRQAGERPEVVA